MKKKMLFLFLSILLSFSAVATDQKQVLVPYYDMNSDLFGYKDSISEKIVIPAQFAKVYPFSDGLAAVNIGGIEEIEEIDEEEDFVYFHGGLWGFINPVGKFVIPAKYYSITFFSNGTSIVGGFPESDSIVRYGLINTKGVFVIPMIYERLSSEDDNRYIATKDSLVGVLDNSGKVLIPIMYDYIDCSNEYAIVKKDTLEGLFRLDNTMVVPIENRSISLEDNMKFYTIYNKGIYPSYYHISGLKFDSKDEIDTELSVVSVAGKYGIIDNEAHFIVPLKYDKIERFWYGKYTLAYQNGKSGFLSNKGVETVPCKYDYLSNFYDGLALAEIEKKKGYIDTLGNIRIPLIYDETYVFDGNVNIKEVLLNSKHGLINISEGKVLIQPLYDYIVPFSSYFVKSILGGVLTSRRTIWGAKLGLIDMNGQELFPPKYNYIGEFIEDRALVIKDGRTDSTTGLFIIGKYGFINSKGEEVIPLIYSDADDFSKGMANVTLNGTKIVIRPDGKKWFKSYQNICYAICAEDSDAILDFLDKGVDLNTKYSFDCWNSGKEATPFQILMWKGKAYNKEILPMFLKKGLDLNKVTFDLVPTDPFQYDIIKILLDNGYNVNKKGASGTTILWSVVDHIGYGDVMFKILKMLLERKADVNSTNDYKMTPLQNLSCSANNAFAIPCANLLLENGADVFLESDHGFSALKYAQINKAPSEFKALLKKAEKKKR